MEWEVYFWVLFFFMDIGLVAFNLYQIMCLSDLEADYMNPYESSSRINAIIVPEFIFHGVFCALFLVTGHWLMFLLTLPIAYYNTTLYMKRLHLLDVTEVYRSLYAEKRYRMIKLGFYFLLFIVIIFSLPFRQQRRFRHQIILSRILGVNLHVSYMTLLVVSVVNSVFDEDGEGISWWE